MVTVDQQHHEDDLGAERDRDEKLAIAFERSAAEWGASAAMATAEGFKARAAEYRDRAACSQAAAERIRARLTPAESEPVARVVTWDQMRESLISADPSSFGRGFLGFLRWAGRARRAMRSIRRRR